MPYTLLVVISSSSTVNGGPSWNVEVPRCIT